MNNINSKRNKEIRLMLSEEEYQIAQENAKKLGMKVAPYIRKSALNPTIVEYNYAIVKYHTEYLKKVRNRFFEVAKSIFFSEDYKDADVEHAWEIMQQALKSEKVFLSGIKSSLRKHRRKKRLEANKYEK